MDLTGACGANADDMESAEREHREFLALFQGKNHPCPRGTILGHYYLVFCSQILEISAYIFLGAYKKLILQASLAARRVLSTLVSFPLHRPRFGPG